MVMVVAVLSSIQSGSVASSRVVTGTKAFGCSHSSSPQHFLLICFSQLSKFR